MKPFTIMFMVVLGAIFSFAMTEKDIVESKSKTTKSAILAGGCFWCMEHPFDELPGVVSTTVGYAGGKSKNPTYRKVSAGSTGHAEVIKVEYDPQVTSYEKLLEVFWRNIDPTTPDRQFCDRGSQYRSAIFYLDDEQRRIAKKSKSKVEQEKKFADRIVTEISKATQFYEAEDYHQDYYIKNPIRYKLYRYNCGRDKRLQELWG